MAQSQETKETENVVEPVIDSDSDAAIQEIEFDSLDLKLDNLVDTIKEKRELAFSPDVLEGAADQIMSLPEIMGEHGRHLGLTEKQFARAAENQGLDLNSLIQAVGREGRDASDVFKELESDGMVSLKPLAERKEGMKQLQRKRMVRKRGQQIKDLGKRRLLSGEKQFKFTPEELESAKAVAPVDFKKIKDSSKRQAAVAQVVYDMGSAAGLSKDQMAAILANGFSESLLDPFAKPPGKEDSHGVWQFNRSAGEGKGFTVEQLQDPRFQMERIVEAVKSRDELEGFRNPEADAKQLTTLFMSQFEKPDVQDDKEIRRRQNYLGQANRLLDQAAKTAPKRGKSLAALDREKRIEALNIIERGAGPAYVLKTDKESVGGDVQNEIARRGSAEWQSYWNESEELTNYEKSSNPERAKIIAQILSEVEDSGLKSAFEGAAFQKLMTAGIKYDTGVVAKKLGMSQGAFMAAAEQEGTQEKELYDQILKANKRHVALYLTVGKLNVPAMMSYEFMDPDNDMEEYRTSDQDSYFERLFETAGRNRVQLIGLKNGMPVYRAEDNLESVFNKLNLHLSLSAGALRRLMDGPEGESILEALQEGSLEGIKNADDFTKLMLSREGANDSDLQAFAYGSLGFLVDVLAPDPTLGLAKAASKARTLVKGIQPLINKKYVPAALDNMATAANDMVETQKLINRASEAFAAGQLDDGRKLVQQARAMVTNAEQAEKSVRNQLIHVMRKVDQTDANIANEMGREIPLMTGKGADDLQKTLGFSDFGMKRDFVHPAVERVLSRSEAEGQLIPFPEFFSLSRKLDRLDDLARRVQDGNIGGAYTLEVQQKVMQPLVKNLNKELIDQGFTQAVKKGQTEKTRRAVADLLDFVYSREAAELITQDPVKFQDQIGTFLSSLPKPKKGQKGFDIAKLRKDIEKGNEEAKEIFDATEDLMAGTDLSKQLIDVTNSLAGIAESRGAAHALVRSALAKQEKIKVDPIIQSVANRYEEIGTQKISNVALAFRREVEEAFPALRGDAAMHIARNLDERLKAIARTTNESVDEIYERRQFKDIIGRFKREMLPEVEDAARGVTLMGVRKVAPKIGVDPKIEKMEDGFERLTSKEIRDLDTPETADFLSGLVFRQTEGPDAAIVVQTVGLPSQLRGKGIATSMYVEALRVAKKRGVGFSSDVNPSPEAVSMYRRLIDGGVPFEEVAIRMPDTGEVSVRFRLSADQVANLSDDAIDIGRFGPKPGTVTDIGVRDFMESDVLDFMEETQRFVRAMEEAPTVENFILEISKVARKELDADQMGAVTRWLATKGIKVGHKGAVFTADDPAIVAQAEEAFAKAFTEYAKGAPPPTPDTTSAFERVRDRVLASFASAKNARVDGAKFNPTPEIEKVFDDLLRGQLSNERGAPTILKMLRRTLLDDLPDKIGDEYLVRIAQESDRLGYPISVKELKAKIKQAHKKFLKDPDADVTIELPGPVSLGGLLSPSAKSSYTLDELGRGFASYSARKGFAENTATRKIALDSEINAVKELSPTQMIDQFVTTSGPVARWAKGTVMGGDAVADMRGLPPQVREAVMSGVRMTQQSVGDTVTLIHEGDFKKLVRYMSGGPGIKFKSGRNALSAGHDMMGSSAESLTTFFANAAQNPQTRNSYLILTKLLNDQAFLQKGWEKTVATQEEAISAVQNIVYVDGGSDLLQKLFAAGGMPSKDKIDVNSLKYLETITYSLGVTKRKGEYFSEVGDSAAQFERLYRDLDTITDRSKDGPVANRVSALLAGYGQAAKARLEWVNLGIATDAKTAANFKKWIIGESVTDPVEMAKVQEAFRIHGYSPRFLEAADLEDLNFFVPRAARKKLAMALEQAVDPNLTDFGGDLLEAVGRGIKEVDGLDKLAMAWTYRYLKTRMVRGHYILKSRYFFMNTLDHFNQMSQIVGFRPALVSTMRIMPQTFASNPAGQAAILAAQRFGPDEAGEAVRMALQKLGDEGADWAAKLMRSSKWRGNLNDILEGRKGFVMVDGVPVSNLAIRQIGVEEGLSASFDTAELGTKIYRAGEMFLEQQNKKAGGPISDLLGFRVPGAQLSDDLVKVAEDIAEGWSERERYGAMLTLVEMGVEPRKAARLVIDGLYDYAGSMSKADRHWLVNVFFPFWAFQKNANRQLIDVIFSPRGAYRLGALNRAYSKGTDLISELIYEDMVDPLGVHTDALSPEQRDAYEALKANLCADFDVDSINDIPVNLKRQIRMAFSGRDSLFEHGKWYEIDARGLDIRKLYRGKGKGKIDGAFELAFARASVERPSKASMPRYDKYRDSIRIPYAMNEQNKIFQFLKSQQDQNRTFTSVLVPEQSYKAAANHISLVLSSSFAMLTAAMDLGPDYLTDAYAPDDSDELFNVSKPLLDLFQPDRALLASDIAAMSGLKDQGAPYRVAPLIAKLLDQYGYEVLAVNPKEDPLAKRLEYQEAKEAFEKGDITVLPDDEYLMGETLVPTQRYYINGGLGALMIKHSPVDELNTILKKFEQTPYEEREGLRGEIQRWMRQFGVDVRDVDPTIIASRTTFELPDEAGGEFLDVKRKIRADYVDTDSYVPEEPKPFPEDVERLERLKKRDPGDMEIDLE